MMAAAARSNLRHSLALVVLVSSSSFLALMYTIVTPVLPGLAAHFGNDARATLVAQLVMSMPSFGMIVGGLVSGRIVERLGAPRALWICLAIYGLSGSAGLYVEGTSALLLSRLVLGGAAAGIATAAMTCITQRCDGVVRARIIGYQSACGAAVGLLSMLLSGVLTETGGWRVPFGLYFVSLLILCLALWTLESDKARPVADSRSTGGSALALWPLYLLCVPLYGAVFMTSTQGPFLLKENGISSASLQSLIISMASMMNAIGAWSYGRVQRRIGSRSAFCLSLALMAGGQLALGLSRNEWDAGFACGLAGLGAGLLVPHLPHLILERADESCRSRAVGIMYSALFLGSFLNPVVVAPIAARFSVHGALMLSGGLLACGALIVALRGRAGTTDALMSESPGKSAS